MDIIKVNVVNKSNNALPAYAKPGDAGMDVRANVSEPVTLKPGERMLVPTGLYFEIPIGFECQVRPRSGLALNYGISLANAIGTLDSGYRNEVGVILINHGQEDFVINPGERIAQLVFARYAFAEMVEVEELDMTNDRGGGLGHTGTE